MGYATTDPAFLLGSALGLWIGLGGSCLVAVRRKGTGSLADLGLDTPRWADVALGVGFGIAGVIAVSIIAATLEAIDSEPAPRRTGPTSRIRSTTAASSGSRSST